MTCLWSGWCSRCCPEPLCQPNQCLPPHPSSCVFSGFEGAKRRSADQVAAQSRYVNPTNACNPTHPALFVSGFEGAKRQRLCRPSGNPLALNPAGVLPFRMRAHGDAGGCDVPLEWLVLTVLPRAVTSTQPMPATSPSQLCF